MAKKISQKDVLSQAPIDLLRRKLIEIRSDIPLAREKGSFSAVASLHRLEADILKTLVQHTEATTERDPLEDLSDAELEEMTLHLVHG